jgi:hypothetical protein
MGTRTMACWNRLPLALADRLDGVRADATTLATRILSGPQAGARFEVSASTRDDCVTSVQRGGGLQ